MVVLQAGWEEKQMRDGRIFFIDHSEWSTACCVRVHVCVYACMCVCVSGELELEAKVYFC